MHFFFYFSLVLAYSRFLLSPQQNVSSPPQKKKIHKRKILLSDHHHHRRRRGHRRRQGNDLIIVINQRTDNLSIDRWIDRYSIDQSKNFRIFSSKERLIIILTTATKRSLISSVRSEEYHIITWHLLWRHKRVNTRR